MTQVIDIAVKAPKILRVDGRDYRLSFPLPVIAELEVKLGRNLKLAGDWLRIETKEVRDILAAALRSYHPNSAEDVADTIADQLEPEEIAPVIDALCSAAFPKAMAQVLEEMEKVRARNGLAALPNGRGGTDAA